MYLLGPGPTEEQLEAHYQRSQKWDVTKGLGSSMEPKCLFDSFWPQTYHVLKKIMNNIAITQPVMIIADHSVEAVKDIHVEYQLPIAVVRPNMPFLMLSCSYIPSQPCFQLEGTLTSETASMWLRINNRVGGASGSRSHPEMDELDQADTPGQQCPLSHPSPPEARLSGSGQFLFWSGGPGDLPPTCALVGPLLSSVCPRLNQDVSCQEFMDKHRSVLYISLGTLVIVSNENAVKIINGIMRLMQEQLIDGVVWAIGRNSRQDLDGNQAFQIKNRNEASF